MKRCSIIATTLLQNNRTRMLLYKNLLKELQILKRFCKCSGRFVPVFFKLGRLAGGRGGGGRYSFYICAAPRGRVFAPFWSEKRYTGIAHFGLESGMVFEGTTGVYERIYCFNSKMSKKEREIYQFEMDLKNFFVCTPNFRLKGARSENGYEF